MRRTCRLLVASTMVTGAVATVLAAPAIAASVSLSVQASPSFMPAGVSVYNVATVNGGVNPTGTLTSSLYGPNDATCSRPAIFTASKPVAGNGNYQSAWYTTSAAGSYRWVVAYSGDGAHPPATTACADPGAEVVVTKRTPTLAVTSSLSPTTGAITATATLDKGTGPAGPTGTLTYKLYGPNNPMCGGAPAFTSTRAVSGNGTYTSDPFRPTAAGTYRWVLAYSGDADNWGAMTVCADAAGTVTVTARPVAPTLAVAAPRAGRAGVPVRATASLGSGAAPTGTITFKVFGPRDGACAGSPVSTSSVAVAGNATYTSGPFTPPDPGTYRWVASYGGDPGHSPVATSCGQPASTTAVAQVNDDYDGDGDTDRAIYRPSNGGWYMHGGAGVAWGGVPGDVPVPGDYDGDGDTDVAIYRPSNGGWYVKGGTTVAWGGVPGDVPVPGDYDGDGDTDLAIFRPSNGGWYLHGIGSMAWGAPGDIPVPGDYDGDGKADFAVHRPGDGCWYVRNLSVVAWGGVPGDLVLTLPAAIHRPMYET